jgi:hypothetical protein
MPLAVAAALLTGAVPAHAAPGAGFTIVMPTPSPCYETICSVGLSYDPAQLTGPGTLEVEWDHHDPAAFAPDASVPCVPGGLPMLPCLLFSPFYATPGDHTVMLRVTDADASQATATRTVSVAALPGPPPLPTPSVTVPPITTTPTPTVLPAPKPRPPRSPRPPRRPSPPAKDDGGDGAYDLCRDTPPNVSCREGGGMQTAGGGEKVSHKGWPRITGVFWKVRDSTGRRKTGGSDNDELLGHHGSDTLDGGKGHDVLWGDWDPSNNNTRQRDVLIGGAGNDFIYPSHGTTRVSAGSGKDYIWAFYGKGTIDCGAGYDTVRVRLNGAFRLRNCEKVGHFCQFGADGHGGCLKPGGRRVVDARVG